MLVIFSGLPGAGKSAIANALADRIGAVYLRIDSIEQAIRSSGVLAAAGDVGPAGYVAACRIAADNLENGLTVIVDSVNPVQATRNAYRDVAQKAGSPFLDVEAMCSDPELHRLRVETRPSTVSGLALPTWPQVQSLPYEAWDRPRLALDTAALSVGESVAKILDALSEA